MGGKICRGGELGGGCVRVGDGILELAIDLGRERFLGELVEHELDVFLEEVLAEARWQSVVVREASPVGVVLGSSGAGGGGRQAAEQAVRTHIASFVPCDDLIDLVLIRICQPTVFGLHPRLRGLAYTRGDAVLIILFEINANINELLC